MKRLAQDISSGVAKLESENGKCCELFSSKSSSRVALVFFYG